MNDSQNKQKSKLLAKMLQNAVFDGWTQETLLQSGQAVGLTQSQTRRLFPNGPRQVIAFYAAELDKTLSDKARGENLSNLKIRERIGRLITLRLELMRPNKEALRRALSARIIELDGVRPILEVARTVDLMWRLAGDQSVDFNWYTKRFLLAGVYTSTLLFWLNDRSIDEADTEAFMIRRINNILTIQKIRGELEEKIRHLPNPISVLTNLRS